MKVPHIIGADLSKKTIDFASHLLKSHLKVENNSSGFKELIRWLKLQKIQVSKVMIVMEHTGLYSHQLEQFLHRQQLAFTKISALAIKRSMGLVRGKTDKQDALRIAQYGFEKRDRLVAIQPVDPNLERLQMLHSTRARLVKQRTGLKTVVKEYQLNYLLTQEDILIKSQLQLITNFDRQILQIEDEIHRIIEAQKTISKNNQLLQSIKGVGKVLAVATIVKTGNFKRFTNARKFACFCGTAPFKHESGTSIRGRTRISHLADKELKTLLDLAAKSAILYDKELREYYLQRIQNGKSNKSTRNVIRNKIIGRMFAVIKRQTPFVENYLETA